ncbi:hypothetical protein B296_00013374, partial [Ensete ventricosum]
MSQEAMAPNDDCASSTLLCVEDASCILGFDNEDDGDDREEQEVNRFYERKRCDLYGDLRMGFPSQVDERLASLVRRETEHMPRDDYAERLRSGALDLRGTLAVKEISYIVLQIYHEMSFLYFLRQERETKYAFEAKTIQRMELLVLSTLKWRMQAVTPFSYLEFFLHRFSGGDVPTKVLVFRSVELILSTITGKILIQKVSIGSEFLAFRPSEIAAAITLVVLPRTQDVGIEKAVSC